MLQPSWYQHRCNRAPHNQWHCHSQEHIRSQK
ncbi:hypothetical protein LOK49_LG13G02080 [Camellia lanceoleosa]|uniref:Uncharacterized protein n=1 Tax=Camellia lanceoleosa TaxID=1840588 RepID=A0ACC0FKM6_9ERIC|nr:hypothetical protein LOK49_LG13G02080 [Camellia lanceoleosa]